MRDLPLFADWYADGRLLLDELHTTSLRLEEVPDVFATLEQDRGIRPIVEFPGAL
jgi:Zn-dependent alcohol dehydrogenase